MLDVELYYANLIIIFVKTCIVFAEEILHGIYQSDK